MKRIINAWNTTSGNPSPEIWKEVGSGQGNDLRVWRNFRPLPNVQSFRLQITWWDSIMLKFKIRRMQDPVMEVINYRNRSVNRYVKHQLIRLEKYAERIREEARKDGYHLNPNVKVKTHSEFWHLANSIKTVEQLKRLEPVLNAMTADQRKVKTISAYWILSNALMKRSICFRLMALHHVFPKWYKDLPATLVVNLLAKVGILANDPFVRLDYARVYIEKANKEWRPLGVPSPVWRIYLHMMTQFTSYLLDPLLSDGQHGFRPNRGTLTAWKFILQHVIEESNIYEFDMAKFFDSVKPNLVMGILKNRLGLPTIWEQRLWTIITSRIKLPEEQKLEEKLYSVKEEELATFKAAILKTHPSSGDGLHWSQEGVFERGFPQGAPISPLLTVLALEPTLFGLGVPLLMYADDGIFYGDKARNLIKRGPEDIVKKIPVKGSGIWLNEKKSGWVKRDGVWLRPLKFLGMEYNGLTNQLKSVTRKGKSLIYDKERMLEQLNLRDGLKPLEGSKRLQFFTDPKTGRRTYREVRVKGSFVELCRSRFMGFVQSKLYNGSWNQQALWGQMTLKPKSGSFVSHLMRDSFHAGILTNYNASSISVRAVMDIWKQVAKVHPADGETLKTALKKAISDGWTDDKQGPVTTKAQRELFKSWVRKAHFVERGRWLSAYAGSYKDYMEYVERIIENLHANPRSKNWKVIAKEEMRHHYSIQYSKGMDFSGMGRSVWEMRRINSKELGRRMNLGP